MNNLIIHVSGTPDPFDLLIPSSIINDKYQKFLTYRSLRLLLPHLNTITKGKEGDNNKSYGSKAVLNHNNLLLYWRENSVLRALAALSCSPEFGSQLLCQAAHIPVTPAPRDLACLLASSGAHIHTPRNTHTKRKKRNITLFCHYKHKTATTVSLILEKPTEQSDSGPCAGLTRQQGAELNSQRKWDYQHAHRQNWFAFTFILGI